MKFIQAVLCSILLFPTSSFALYGGKKIAASAHPAVVSIIYDDAANPSYNGYICSGVLVSPKKVLTAAHCLSEMGLEVYEDVRRLEYYPTLVKVSLGNKFIRVKDVILAPSYFDSWDHSAEDLAVIELATAVTTVTPIPLASTAELKAGTELTLVARNKSATTSLLSVKRYATATVLKMDGKKSGACRGDSGGAVLLRRGRGWALGGILMYEGEEDCEKKQGVAFFPKGILKHL